MKSVKTDRYFFMGISIWYVILTFFGFAKSFSPSIVGYHLNYHVMIHGIIFTSWIILFIVQTSLISAKYRKLHSKLGMLSILICLAIIPSGLYTIFGIVSKRNYPPYIEIGVDLVLITLFLVYVLFGMLERKQPIKHKRHMVFATFALTTAAISRITFMGVNENKSLQFVILIFPIVLLFIYDYIVKKKIYRINIFNTILFFGLILLSKYLWKTEAWEKIVKQIAELL